MYFLHLEEKFAVAMLCQQQPHISHVQPISSLNLKAMSNADPHNLGLCECPQWTFKKL